MAQELLYFYLLCMGLTATTTVVYAVLGKRSMAIRGITLLVLLNVMTAILWGGTLSCRVFALLLAAVGSFEAVSHRYQGVWRWLLVVSGVLLAAATGYFIQPWMVLLWGVIVVAVFIMPNTIVAHRIWVVLFQWSAVSMGCGALLALADAVPVHWIAMIILVQFNDTLSLMVGNRFGRTKVFPQLSPKKSLGGYVGGTIGFALGMLTVSVLLPVFDAFITVDYLVVGLGLWWVINAGDLLFSKFKRAQQIKDFSGVLPGHGGVLDRFDSFLVLAPIWWLMVRYLL